MKRVFSLVLIISLLVICLTGCELEEKNTVKNSNTVNNTSNTSSTNTTTTLEKFDFLAAAENQMKLPEVGEQIAIMHIKDYGDVFIKFFPDVAPKAVENFIKHSQDGYYNGLTFHRVINDFMIQGGDPQGTGRGGESIWGSPFADEFSLGLVPYRGSLCMANSGKNTNGSQFFIEQANYDEKTEALLKNNGYPENLLKAYKQYGGSMHLFYVHTVFGQVFMGMDVIDEIAKVETDEFDKPTTDVIVESIEITDYSE